MKFECHTEGTCSRNIILEMDGIPSVGTVYRRMQRQPQKGIAALVQGQKGTGCHPENSRHLRS